MTDITETIALDGSTPFTMLGTFFDWSSSFVDTSAGTDPGTTTLNLTSSGDWYLFGVSIYNDDPRFVNFNLTDAADGGTRYLDYLKLHEGVNTITLNDLEIRFIHAFRDSDSTIALGKGFTQHIRLKAFEDNTNAVTIGSGGVGYIRMEAGTNTLTGGDGNVQIAEIGKFGEAGSNTIVGGAGYIANLELSGTSHDITVGTGDIREIKINQGVAVITADSSGEIDVLRAFGQTTLTASANLGSVELGSADDVVSLSGTAVQVSLGDGNNTLTSSEAQVRTVLSYQGDDMLNLTGTGRVYTAHLGQGTNVFNLSDAGRASTLAAWENDDTLNMNSSREVEAVDLSGGNNTINQSAGWIGAARLGSGDDIITVTGGLLKSVYASSGLNTVTVSGGGRIDSYTGSGDVDVITITDGRITNINAGGGNNRITLGMEYTSSVTTFDENDWVKGGSGYVNSIETNRGDDRVMVEGSVGAINTSRGVDRITTGDGWVASVDSGDDQDFVTIGAGGARAVGLGAGNDRLYASGGFVQTVDAWLGNDKIYMGNTWLRYVSLSDGDDYMRITKTNEMGGAEVSGGSGIDTLDFRSTTAAINISLDLDNRWQNIGNIADTADFTVDSLGFFAVTSSTERLVGTAFGDILTGSDTRNENDGENRLTGLGGDDTLSGLGGNDTIFGGSGADMIFGGDGDDYLQGNRDNDTIHGGNGNDVLLGGSGVDLFVFEDSATMGFDRVRDWRDGVDRLDLSDFGFADFAAVEAITADAGVNMRINIGVGNVILVENFSEVDFDVSDVVLV